MRMSARPETEYTKSGDVHIAYQVTGHGPLDLVWVPGFVSHLEYQWEYPGSARSLERLASFSRLIRFDKRGTGLSDRDSAIPTLEQRMEDVRAVMDAVGSKRAALLGISEGGPMSCLFAATYPGRTTALILYGSFARRAWAPDYPFGRTEAEWAEAMARLEHEWGKPVGIDRWAPGAAQDEPFKHWWANYLRLGASPGAALSVGRLTYAIDVRPILAAIRVPTLVLHRSGDRISPVEAGRDMADRIPGARMVELPGEDHLPWFGDVDSIVDEIEEFLTGVRSHAQSDRVLATVLFTDVVGSTERAVVLGDRGWRDLLDGFYAVVRRELDRFRGREVDSTGDGLFASFDGPARAIRCASAITGGVRSLGIEVRTGVHTGECEVMGEKMSGIAVHVGARVAAQAAPSEVLVSSIVRDLVAGSGIRFEDRGIRTLKGVPGEWRLFAVAGT
jgi:pimeloyl-ACP methyl ester carboxylesterase